MKLNQDTLLKVLDTIYAQALVGIPTTGPVVDLAEEYLKKANGDREAAIDSLIKWQIAKNVGNGAIANLGGILLLPVTLPLEITSSLYIQLRTITAIAYLSGHDITKDEVRALCYCCFMGDQLSEVLSEAGVLIGSRITAKVMAALSGNPLTQLQRTLGIRLLSKFGKGGVGKVGKRIPFIGAAIGGTVEGAFAFYTSRAAKKLFFADASAVP